MKARHWLLAHIASLAVALGAATFATGAVAGRTCEAHAPTVEAVTRGLALAQKTADALDATHAQVVVLARAGQDLSKFGLRYSHLGFAYQETAADGSHAWRVVHKLNECGTADSAIYRQGLGEFFLDTPWRYEAAWVVLEPRAQAALLPLLRDDARVALMHHKPYSMVSYAWSVKYQQSNQWALETLAAALQPQVASREAAQSWLRAEGYRPTTLQLGPLTRLGARMTSANVAFDDHPPARRFSDQIDTVTVDSMFEWLQRAGLGSVPSTIQ